MKVYHTIFICRRAAGGGGAQEWRKTQKLPEKVSDHYQLCMCIAVYVGIQLTVFRIPGCVGSVCFWAS
jgi:hypothetical protein